MSIDRSMKGFRFLTHSRTNGIAIAVAFIVSGESILQWAMNVGMKHDGEGVPGILEKRDKRETARKLYNYTFILRYNCSLRYA